MHWFLFLCQKKSFLRSRISYRGDHVWEVSLPMHVFVNSIVCLTEGLETMVLGAIEIYPAGIFLSIEKS